MGTTSITVSTSIELALTPMMAFTVFCQELAIALEQTGLHLEPGKDGSISEGNFQVGRVISWVPGEVILFQWHQSSWHEEEPTQIEIRFTASNDGTRITLTQQGSSQFISGPDELAGWFASTMAAPLLKALAPVTFGDWLTDRQARRPTGSQAREVYRDPLYHYPNFYALLAELALSSDDYLVEIGCGGGALLKEALKSGCRAAAIDHSVDMVRLAQEVNAEAIEKGRLRIQQADAAQLPFAATTFTCAAMTGVLGFLPDALSALKEIQRVLVPGGRLVMLGSDPALRGTLAAPEPMASRLHFYTDDELQQLAIQSGFSNARVVRRDLALFAQQVGIPQEHRFLFTGPVAPLLLAQKD
ncbi:hypothetical protein KDA_44950 [Dictyobacter alpinus]|uniref:Uncharacterized protein n=1 Tax=Dictyobacter alpinus TaxID=2014873 RepID=A0A402BC66_9CHLR|nr:methyltransferase domain-containing protein [Dictyobacter alpinus]GCE29011.1 hypothetical protein KDA_44950 [Dictyobacter alpinus]